MNPERSDDQGSSPNPGAGDHATDEPRTLPGVGDDERESRDQIARTGEPKRDALGNADGAS